MPTSQDFLADPRIVPVPWVESPLFESLLSRMDAPEERKTLARHYHDEGFVVLDDVIEPEAVDKVVAEYERMFDPTTKWDVGPELEELLRRDPSRKQDAWFVSQPVRDLACHPGVLDILSFLYGRDAIPFQTLNFLPGTQQSAHSDNVHFSSLPRKYMCGVWVALEDVDEDNGPLFYYPRSHKLTELELSDMGLWSGDDHVNLGPNYAQCEAWWQSLIEAYGLEKQVLTVKKGQALVWSANLLHGGSPIRDASRTRMSQVTHYYFADCLYYTPIFSNALLGEWFLREHILDIRTGERVQQTLNGEPVRLKKLRNGKFRIERG